MFGLANGEGNHGEDVKELYYYLDATPTHSYMKMLYKYPQQEFPYARLLAENRARGRDDPEFELLETGIFDLNRYFDIFIEFAKASPSDTLIRVTVHNRGPEPATLHVLPLWWFRNTWSWRPSKRPRPRISAHAPDSLAQTTRAWASISSTRSSKASRSSARTRPTLIASSPPGKSKVISKTRFMITSCRASVRL